MQKYSSSPTSLSSPPSALSEPISPTRFLNAGRANLEMDEIIVDSSSVARFGVMQQQAQQLNPPPPDVPLTAAGLPRKKPGRKPGTTVKPKVAPDGTIEPPKQRRARKQKDPNAPPVQRKRKTAPADTGGDGPTPMDVDSRSFSGSSASRQPKITELTSMRMSLEPRLTPTQAPAATSSAESQPSNYSQKVPKRDPVSMRNLLNDDPPPEPQPAAPARQMFDPIRGNYDPVRETMVARDPYGTGAGPLGSPRAPTQVVNRASASPSIASLVDPPHNSNIKSPPPQTYNTAAQSRFQESSSMPPSPSHNTRPAPSHIPKPSIVEVKRPPPPPAPTTATSNRTEAKTTSFTSMTSVPTAISAQAASKAAPSAPVQSKKLAAVAQQDRETTKKASSNSSSPRISGVKDALPSLPGGSERSILDFGKASPGEEMNAPSIVLNIPLNGETNKYVNFMRMAEERYGWDALHPRLAANRERKARIAAASAALEKSGSGQGSADEMEEDIQSDAEASNVEMGGMTNGAGGGGTSGPDGAPAKPARKKRTFKEDEYDKDDDFVDDSELLWEEQAAASRDGFFVYSGPLIQEEETPAVPTGPPRRGRGGGRGSRGGGRGGAARGEGTGRGRGGGPGSRGGSVTRKPRITKLEKEQRDKEKAEREKLAQLTATGKGAAASGTYSAAGALAVSGQGAAAGVTL
ncbi:histone promoter control protein 2 [Naviculisporaceae sp. PSN 640]